MTLKVTEPIVRVLFGVVSGRLTNVPTTGVALVMIVSVVVLVAAWRYRGEEAGTEAGQGTTPESINDAGTVTGVYTDNQYVIHGFIFKKQ